MICAISASSVAKAEAWQVPKPYVLGWTALTTFAITAYFSAVDSNKGSTDVKDWKMDTLTKAVTGARTVFYTGINYLESSYIPNHQAQMADPAAAKEYGQSMHSWLALIKSPIPTATYNSRYEDVIIQPFNEWYDWSVDTLGDIGAKAVASTYIAANNVGYFMVFYPLWSGRFNNRFLAMLPNQEALAKRVHGSTGSVALAIATYSVADVVIKNALISAKNTVAGLMPAPADNSFLRFPDCTICYLGTNLLGRNGPIAKLFSSEAQPEHHDEL